MSQRKCPVPNCDYSYDHRGRHSYEDRNEAAKHAPPCPSAAGVPTACSCGRQRCGLKGACLGCLDCLSGLANVHAHSNPFASERDALKAEVERLKAWGEAQILEGKNRYAAACAVLAALEKQMAEARALVDTTISHAKTLSDAVPCTRSVVLRRLGEISAALAPERKS